MTLVHAAAVRNTRTATEEKSDFLELQNLKTSESENIKMIRRPSNKRIRRFFLLCIDYSAINYYQFINF